MVRVVISVFRIFGVRVADAVAAAYLSEAGFGLDGAPCAHRRRPSCKDWPLGPGQVSTLRWERLHDAPPLFASVYLVHCSSDQGGCLCNPASSLVSAENAHTAVHTQQIKLTARSGQ